MKTKITRIPKELDELAVIFKKDFNEPSKTSAFRKIVDFTKIGYFDFMKKKKSQLLELFAIAFALIVVIVFFGIAGWGITQFSTSMNETINGTNANNELQTFSINIGGWIDFVIISYFFLLILGIIIINFFLSTSIFAMIFYFLAFFFVGGVFKMFHNTLDMIKSSDGIGTYIQTLPVTNFLIENYYGIMLIIFLFLFIIFFAKPQGGTRG